MKKIVSVLMVMLLAFSLTACFGSKITQANYDKIEVGTYSLLSGYDGGMSYSEVKSILGSPTDSAETTIGTFSATVYTWEDGDSSITVSFINDQAVAKVPYNLE